MAVTNGFQGWNEEDIESALQTMGCEELQPPRKLNSLHSDACIHHYRPHHSWLYSVTKDKLLDDDRTEEKPTCQECLKSLQSTKFEVPKSMSTSM